MKIPNLGANPAQRGIVAPAFQSQNALQNGFTPPPGSPVDPQTTLANINNATLNQQTSGVQAQLANSGGTDEQRFNVNVSLNTANTAAQQGDYQTAFQATRQAQQDAANLPPAPPPPPAGKGIPTRQGGT